MPTFYSSRSATETYERCDRLRFLENIFLGIGLTLKAINFPLVVGGDTHLAIANILQAVKDLGKEKFVQEEGEKIIEQAITDALAHYEVKINSLGYFDQQNQLPSTLYFTYCEQKALMEALVRTWCWIELPRILGRYEVLEVEQEYVQTLSIPNDPIKESVWLKYQGTPDAILKDIESQDLVVYSLKTAKTYDDRTRKGYEHDLQGIMESWLVEQEMEKRNRAILKAVEGIGHARIPNFQSAIDWITNQGWPTRVMGQQMCYLVKGLRRKTEDDSVTFEDGSRPEHEYTASPLVRGYKKHTPGETQYAHSLYFPNPNNKSGWGRLGKGWEPFNVWENEQVGGIKGWIQTLASGNIQPECGEILKKQVITPPEYFRSGMDLEGTINEVMAKEREVIAKIRQVEEKVGFPIAQIKSLTDPDVARALQEEFPRCRRSCHYPTDCAMVHICYNRRVAENPLNHGLEGVPIYELRTPHHKAEAEALQNGHNSSM